MSIVTIIDDKDKRYQYIVDSDVPPIGKGGMGTVYKGVRVDAANPSQKREVAIKFIHDGLAPQIIERERRTADIMIQNENVVEMMGFITMTVNTSQGPKTRYFVVSELLNGVSLLNLLKGVTTDVHGKEFEFAKMMLQRFRIDRTQFVTDIANKVLNGLQAIHNAGYIHRDIDPSNVMLTSQGQVKIIDFGIAKKIDPTAKTEVSLTKAGDGMGKAVYTSPEVLSGQLEAQNATSDLYSVGIMIYALAVGRLPYSGTATEIMIKKVTKPVPIEDIENHKLRRVVKTATDNNQSKRYKSAQHFMNDLNSTKSSGFSFGGSKSSAGETAVGTPAGGGKSLPGWAWALIITGGVLALAGILTAIITN